MYVQDDIFQNGHITIIIFCYQEEQQNDFCGVLVILKADVCTSTSSLRSISL